jgi:hypothetical protein
MNGVSREKVLALWLKLAQGDLVAIEAEPWLPGSHSPPLSAEMRAQLVREAEERSLASNRAFYEALGPERADVPCRRAGCRRGAISYSVLCRVHHFESVCRQPCPFSEQNQALQRTVQCVPMHDRNGSELPVLGATSVRSIYPNKRTCGRSVLHGGSVPGFAVADGRALRACCTSATVKCLFNGLIAQGRKGWTTVRVEI